MMFPGFSDFPNSEVTTSAVIRKSCGISPSGKPSREVVEVAGIDRENEGKIMGKPTQTMKK